MATSKAAFAAATKKVEAVYAYPYLNHLCLKPMNATALYTADRCEVWVPTQDGEAALAAVVEASGLPVVKCDVHKINIGGACGRRIFQDYLHQAVRIARQIPGTPVKLLWSREEDMIHGRYHPIMKCKLVGAFDKDSRLTGLHMRLSGQSIIAGHPGIADLIAPGVAFGAIHGRKKLLANDCCFPIVRPGFSVSTHGWLEGRFATLLLTSSS